MILLDDGAQVIVKRMESQNELFFICSSQFQLFFDLPGQSLLWKRCADCIGPGRELLKWDILNELEDPGCRAERAVHN